MANLAASAVTRDDYFYEGGVNGRRFKSVPATLVLTGQGTATNKILASLFGLTTIRRVHSCRVTDDSLVIDAAPSNDGTFILLKAAGTNSPADYTATVKLVVVGTE